MDTDTYYAGAKATIEASNLRDQSPADVVRALKEEVLPKVQAKLAEAAAGSGSSYPQSIVKELETVKDEVTALAAPIPEGGAASSSNVKSAASAIEQQINALKATLGFD